ncbi:ABC transporter-associated protein EcsC [Pedobacter sp. KBW06]|uniref:EcsC family protein n=1 Tax=Pedobacter sp. KBW06 TaxID=2153359 RepID=UPI000F5A5E4A|nr:EcsC family protein [Pedobacter sp. KBW06]RQO71809.1 ABC transporter-associated protein EcsC [Pedobacter sp. KBW06]
MDKYQENIRIELEFWKREMMEKPSFLNKMTNNIQKKINSYIPEKVHTAITVTIKKMVQAVLYGSTYTTSILPAVEISLLHREALVKQKIDNYCKTGAAEGGITGAGGFLMSMADFPVLIGIKMKMLFEIATIYGFDVKDYKERLYILYIFQLAFSSQHGRTKIFMHMENWDQKRHILPENSENFDWKTFQQEYRDYIDLAKMAQLLPVVGAAVGAVANYQLIKKLGKTAIQAYRMRIIGQS